MKREEKKTVSKEYNETLRKSWTYAKMTEEERKKWEEVAEWITHCGTLDHLNTKIQIQITMLSSYHAFLEGIGYNGPFWRE